MTPPNTVCLEHCLLLGRLFLVPVWMAWNDFWLILTVRQWDIIIQESCRFL